MGQEYELKFAATAQQQAQILAAFPTLSPIAMETVYYDTPDGTLSRMRWTLRRRLENGTAVCTLKTPAQPGGARGEWEVPCPDIVQAIPLLIEIGAPEALRTWTKDGLVPLCGARFTRLAGSIPCNAAAVELALDSGILHGGDRTEPLCEVEVELKHGTKADADAFAAALAARFALSPEPRSKFRRALALAQK